MRDATLDSFYTKDDGGDWVVKATDGRYITSPNVLDGFVTSTLAHARRFVTANAAARFIKRCAICADTDQPFHSPVSR